MLRFQSSRPLILHILACCFLCGGPGLAWAEDGYEKAGTGSAPAEPDWIFTSEVLMPIHGIVMENVRGPGFRGRDLLLSDGSSTLHLKIPDQILQKMSNASALNFGASVVAQARPSLGPGDAFWYELEDPKDLQLKLLPLNTALRTHQTQASDLRHMRLEVALGLIALVSAISAAICLLLYRRRLRQAQLLSVQERENVEEALLRGDKRLQHLLSANSGVIYSLVPDATGLERFTFLSENVEELLGYAVEDCMHTSGWWRDCVHPDEIWLIESGMKTVLRTGSLDREFRFLRKDGSYIWVHDRQRLLRNVAGEPHEVVGTWMDVTERKWSEKIKEVFASLGARLGAVSTPKEAAAFILRAADAIFRWNAAFVALHEPEEGELRSIISFDTIDGRKQEIPPVRSGVRPLTQKVLEGEAQIVLRQPKAPDDDVELTRFGEENRRSESLMFAPITHNKSVFGILSIQSYSSRAYDERDLQVLQVLANYCSAALMRTFAEEERKAVEEALRESEERYALALRGANDGLWDWDFRKNSIYYSPRWKSMLGYAENEVSDSTEEWKSRIHSEDVARVRADLSRHLSGQSHQLETQYRMKHKDNSYRWMLLRGVAERDSDGNPLRMAGSMTDITQRRKAEQQLLQGAYYDALTSLPNRLLFLEQLRRTLGRAERRSDFVFAVLFLDLDRFKIINDSLGHLVGDKLLINVAERLRICVRPEDMVARLGGDEFTVLLEEVSDPGQATRVAERIQEEISKPFQLEGHEVWTTASIGIAFSSTGYEKPEEILRDADAAMYRAKAKGKARHEMFDQEMHSRALKTLETEGELRRALERGELRVYYQPVFDLSSNRIAGFEALVRWQHPERGLVLPGEFISIAEETGLITPLGYWVFSTACGQMTEWSKQLPADWDLTLSVNISRKQFSQPDLLARLQQAMYQTGMAATSVALEITESMLMEHTDSLIRLLHDLKGLGVQLHVDDFGTGYSSLAYLHRFPLDKLKIDRTFVSKIESDARNAEIVRAIVTLARGLGMDTIAEGIETEEQASILRQLECSFGQGYLLSTPLSPEDTYALLQRTMGETSLQEAGAVSEPI